MMWDVYAWFQMILLLVAVGIISRDLIGIYRDVKTMRLQLKRLTLRKQDWTPREDAALWKADGR